MKKILNVLLVAVMLLSMLGIMVGCGGEAAPAGDANANNSAGTTETTGSQSEVSLPAALANITKIDAPDLTGTGWILSGGMVDGVEMEEDDLQTVLTNFGGSMEFIFPEAGKVILSNGEEGMESTYDVSEGKVLYMDFGDYKYHAVFTDIQGMTVMIVANPDEPNSALYFAPIEEG